MPTITDLAIRKGVSTSPDPDTAVRELFEAIGAPADGLVVFFCAASYDLDRLGPALARHFGGTTTIGCTTAGEISPLGYLDGTLTGVSLEGPDFRVAAGRLDDLANFEFHRGHELVATLRRELGRGASQADSTNTFGLLLVDGLSMREEAVVSALFQKLGSIPLFGGSAGDGLAFRRTRVYHEGRFHADAAVFALVQPGSPFEVFRTQHFVPSDKKMVVTKADVSRRVVTEVNGEPAGREYAQMVGLEVDKLTPLIFATHPVVVRIGGQHYVRSIQKVNEDESLTFFCAIEEGLVLTVAQGVDLVQDLEGTFGNLAARLGPPRLVLGCDCVLRNLEMTRSDLKGRVGAILAANNVIGFSTYGEQFNAMHVNQTFTGVAIGSRGAR
ncbi:MAG: FIST C-terminal domain-containing protein [Planctomycetes bacterium]|nr:FIST C-terminal domain-containing protein [Planctomycetota bacterium]